MVSRDMTFTEHIDSIPLYYVHDILCMSIFVIKRFENMIVTQFDIPVPFDSTFTTIDFFTLWCMCVCVPSCLLMVRTCVFVLSAFDMIKHEIP